MPFTFADIDDTVNPSQMANDANTDTRIVSCGSSLYAAVQDGRYSKSKSLVLMYKNSGSGWVLKDDANSKLLRIDPDNSSSQSLFVYGTKLYVLACKNGSYTGAPLLQLLPFDTATDTWGSLTSLPYKAYQSTYVNHSKFFGRYRPDGSFILIHQDSKQNSPSFFNLSRVSVEKLAVDGVTWTTLQTFDPGADDGSVLIPDTELQGAVMASDGTIHVFLCQSHSTTVDAFSDYDLFHFSISTADVISSLHLVEQHVVTNGNFGSMNRGGVADIIPDGECELAFPYAFGESDVYSTIGELHVARGNLLSDPLDPPWTIDVVSSTNAPEPVGYGASVAGWNANSLQVLYLCSDLHCYWRSSYPSGPGDNDRSSPGPPVYKLWHSVRTWGGAWSVPDMLYDPLTSVGVMSVYAVRYETGKDKVGLMVDVQIETSVTFVANVAPTVQFASSGGASCGASPCTPTATLTLQKVVSNTHGGTAVATDWTVRAVGPVTLSGAGSASSPGLPVGTYALSEGGPPGYSASAWVCVGGSQSGANITLANGDDVTCTITNSDLPPGPPVPPPSMCEPVTVTTPTPSLAAYNEATEKQGS